MLYYYPLLFPLTIPGFPYTKEPYGNSVAQCVWLDLGPCDGFVRVYSAAGHETEDWAVAGHDTVDDCYRMDQG